MATYKGIQGWIEQKHNTLVKTCWIADVKRKHNLTTRVAANRKEPKSVTSPCPQNHVEKIEGALIHFNMVSHELVKLKKKQEVWMRCLNNRDDRNSISLQIEGMVWDMGVFKIINECLKLAPPRKNGGVQINSAIWFLIDRCFFESQMLAIRRLTDNYGLHRIQNVKRTGAKEKAISKSGLTGYDGVYSLKALILDMKENIALLTRENLFKLNGLGYDVELLKRNEYDYIIREQKRIGGETPIVIVPNDPNLRPDYSKAFHERIDKFSGVTPEHRKSDDTVQVKILDDLIKNLENAVEKEECYVNKHIAHAATKESRDSAKINLKTDPPTLQSILEAQETIAKTANFIINIFEFSGLVFSGIPVTIFDIVEYIENPFATLDDKAKLEEVFSTFRVETRKWHKWEELIEQ